MTNFIINRSDAIGDTILTLPLAEIIKKNLPDSKIIFIISPLNKDLFQNNPFVDELWVFQKNKSFFSKLSYFFKMFKSARNGHYLYVGGSHLPSFCAWFFRMKFRGGLLSRWPSFLFLNKGTRQKRSMVEMHETFYNLNLLNKHEINWDYKQTKEVKELIFLTDEEKQNGKDQLQELCQKNNQPADRPFIFVHPGMTGHTLNWSSRNYARFIAQLEKQRPSKFNFVVSYTPSDKKYISSFEDELKKMQDKSIKDKVMFLDGSEKGLRNYITMVSQASFFLGPSTGTTHIANAFKINQICIYSPIKTQSVLRWGPFFHDPSRAYICVPQVVCGEAVKCALDDCPYYECMGKIEVKSVVEKAISMLEKETNHETTR